MIRSALFIRSFLAISRRNYRASEHDEFGGFRDDAKPRRTYNEFGESLYSDASSPRGGGGRGGSASGCYSCGEEGHIATHCPNPRPRRGGRGRGGGRGGGTYEEFGESLYGNNDRGGRGGGSASACFSCGEEGHIATQCPNPRPRRGRGRGGGRGRSNNSFEDNNQYGGAVVKTPRPGDWLCGSCQTVNFQKNPQCRQCSAPVTPTSSRWTFEDGTEWKEKVPKPGDWTCTSCNYTNFKARTDCYKCQLPVPPDVERVPIGELKKGQYLCEKCLVVNNAHQWSCIKCKLPRPESAGPVTLAADRPGDWKCAGKDGCGTMNQFSRKKCNSCERPKDRFSEVIPGRSKQIKWGAGDWTCANCKTMNFRDRLECFSCYRAKDSASIVNRHETNDANRTFESSFPGDWKCKACAVMNLMQRETCFACKGARMSDCAVVPDDHVTVFRAPETTATKEITLPGDWVCSACDCLNYRNRKECVECKEVKTNACAVVPYPPSAPFKTLQPGDWQCAACNECNFASLSVCGACSGGKKDESSVKGVERTWQDSVVGDWKCAGCSVVNLLGRKECQQCQRSHDGECEVKKIERPPIQLGKSFQCGRCEALNFSWRRDCHACHEPRPALVVEDAV